MSFANSLIQTKISQIQAEVRGWCERFPNDLGPIDLSTLGCQEKVDPAWFPLHQGQVTPPGVCFRFSFLEPDLLFQSFIGKFLPALSVRHP